MEHTKWLSTLILGSLCLFGYGESQAASHDSGQSTRKSSGTVVNKTLGTASDKAIKAGLTPLNAPFHRPFQYIGMTIARAAKATGGTPNAVGNIIIDSAHAHMLLEAEGNFISYIDVELKQTAPCRQSHAFDSEPVFGALSINPSELNLVRKQTSVDFSSKYYGM